MGRIRSVLATFAFASTAASAQMPPSLERPHVDVAALLNLDATRAQRVEAILESARAKMRSARQQIGRPSDDTTRATMRAAMEAIRQDTDKQLATVLSADDIGKLNAALHHPPPR